MPLIKYYYYYYVSDCGGIINIFTEEVVILLDHDLIF